MADAKITKAPTARPAYMTTPKRQSGGSREMKVSWKNPSSATDRNNPARATGMKIIWDIVLVAINDSKKTLVRHFEQSVGDNTLTTATLNLNSFRSREFPKEIWTRDTFYPGSSTDSVEWNKMWCIRTLRCGVYYTNAKGTGPGTITQTNFNRPFATTVARPVQAENTGHIDCKVTTPKGDDHMEVHSGWWVREVYDSRTKKTNRATGKVTRGSSKNVAFDVSDRMQLTYDQYVRFTVRAHTRGYWGDSEEKHQTLYVSYPREPKISGVSIPSKHGSDKVTVLVDTQRATDKHPEHPVTGVRIQVLRSCAWATEGAIPSEAEWEDLDVQDDGECTALSCAVSDIRPAVDTYTWIRLKTWNQIETIFYRYSKPMRMELLETQSPTAEGDGCVITKATAGNDGKCIKVVTTYDEDNKNTGTQIAWAKYGDAWTSTDQPDDFDATWCTKTSTYTRGGKTRYKGTVEITVRPLDPETKYYFKARRYLDIEDKERTYSEWSEVKECTTLPDPDEVETVGETKAAPVPASVSLIAPSYTPRGEDIDLTWTFQPDSDDNVDEELSQKQTGWEVYIPAGAYTKAGVANKELMVASGTDAKGAYTIPYEGSGSVVGVRALVSKVVAAGGARDSIALRVRVKTSGRWRSSSTRTARIADPPALATFAPTITEQPARLEFYCNQQARLSIVLRAAGASGEMPWGSAFQANGDTIWSGVVNPRWRAFDPTKTAQYAELLQDLADARTASEVTSDWRVTSSAESLEAWRALIDQYGTASNWFSLAYRPEQNALRLYVPKSEGMQSHGAVMASTYDGTEWSAWAAADATTEMFTPEGGANDYLLVTFTNASDYEAFRDGTLVLSASVTTLDKDVSASVEAAQEAIDAYLANDYAYMATVTLPDGLDLWDGCAYEVSATATNATTRLTSETATAATEVDWARQAPELAEDAVTVTPHDETDEDGNHRLWATIELPSEGLADTDRMDVYRVTVDGAYLLYSDASAGDTITDPYAPYDEYDGLAYRVCVRTADGDMSWRDFPYTLRFHALRVEFGSEYVELPYNLALRDSYSKDFEARRYMDGSIDGFFNAGAMRTGGYSTDLIKVEDRAQYAAVKRLGRYAGPCLVRTGEGMCFTANVEPSSIGVSYDSAAINVALDVDEYACDEYQGVRSE